VSEATVKAHLRHIYEKLGVRTRAELLAKRAGRR
jgi:DNA-binding CsgD family transcriptional regulator